MSIVSSGQITITDLLDGKNGVDGKDGIAGKDGFGVKTTVITYSISTSGTTAPTSGWTSSVPSLVKGQYLWTKTVWTYTDNSSETGYSVSYISKDGNNGTDGLAGKDGVGISNTIIEYVGAASGTSKPTSGWSATIPTVPAGQYLWTRTTWQYTDGTSEQGFTNALMGREGASGKDGLAGKDGVGIKSTQIMYAPSISGTTAPTTGWTAQVPTLIKGQYLWTQTTWVYTDNTGEAGYTVSYNAKDGNSGTDGVAGKDGNGIKATTISYAKHTNGITAPTTGFTPAVPSVPAGQFLWTKTVWTYTDNSSETGYSVAMMGLKGDKGDQGNNGTNGVAGKDGKGITGTVITYGLSTSETTQPSTWTGTVPTLVKGQYLWTKTVWTYSDSTNETGYTKTYIAKDGNNGTNGIAGKDGVGISSTAITYGQSTSGISNTGITWTTAVPSVPAGQYLWTKTVWTYTDNSSETGYSVAMMGLKGDKGTNGIAGKDGKGIKATAITYQASTNGTTAPTGTWSAGVPTVAKGSFLWTRTIWTYTDNTTETGYAVAYMGTNGNNGTNGLAGKDGVGINSTTITYASHTNGTTAPTTGFTTAVPSVPAGQFLWTKTVWAYTDNTSETGYSVARMGLKGDKGDQGIKGSDGTSGIIVSSVAPASPKTGQLWQDTSITPQLVKKWTGNEWVIWKMYVENMVVDTISSMSSDLGNMIGGTLKLMDDISVNGTLKKFGIYQSKLGLLSSGAALATTSTFSNSQMGVVSLNKGELRFMVTDYTENLKDVQDAGMSDQNHAFIKFDSYDNGKDVMTIGSSGDIVFKGNTSQDTQWVTLSSGVRYKFMFSRVYISVNIVGNGSQYIQFGMLPQNLRPISDQFLIIANWGTGTADDRHIMVRASDGAVVLWAPKSGVTYGGEVSFTL